MGDNTYDMHGRWGDVLGAGFRFSDGDPSSIGSFEAMSRGNVEMTMHQPLCLSNESRQIRRPIFSVPHKYGLPRNVCKGDHSSTKAMSSPVIQHQLCGGSTRAQGGTVTHVQRIME